MTGRFQSTHPSWGATQAYVNENCTPKVFQSTHPSWGATAIRIFFSCHTKISIHAPIVGCDIFLFSIKIKQQNFNPRTHRGVRPIQAMMMEVKQCISIHAPIVGCDEKASLKYYSVDIFQSTHPSWGATSTKGHIN